MIPSALMSEAFDPRVDPYLLLSLASALFADGRDDEASTLDDFASDLATNPVASRTEDLTVFTLHDLQACESAGLHWRDDHVRTLMRDERDSMGFDRVDLYAPNVATLVRFLASEWGDDDATGGWFSDMCALIEEVPGMPERIDVNEAPDGFRKVYFADPASPQIHEGIVRVNDLPSVSDYPRDWSGLYPFVLPGTARAIAAEFQHYLPNPKAAHAQDFDWFDCDQLFDGSWEVVVQNAPEPGTFDPTAYDRLGFPNDPDGWGTSNLFDVPAYAHRFPPATYVDFDGVDIPWVDFGAVGLQWNEVDATTGKVVQ